jgi:hypothetical protein
MFFANLRYRTAFFFGRWEHLLSRILFVMLVLSYVLYRLKWDITMFLLADIGLWILYWVSHRLEKFAHPQH